VSAAALYYHFSSKEEILACYLESTLERALRSTEEALTAASPRDRLRQAVRAIVLFELTELEQNPLFSHGTYGYTQLVQSLGESERARLEKIQRTYLTLLRTIIEDGIEAGEFAPNHVTVAAFAITGMVANLTPWFREGHGLTVGEAADQYADFAVRMLTPSADEPGSPSRRDAGER
jgi:AcrR family transcriptional regulator